jgi:proteasome lid subunit RPN8/RPN11
MREARISRAVLDDLVAHAIDCRPAECCGVLIGRDQHILEVVRSPNLSADPNRYELDPQVHISARRDARARGLDVLGFYHSHPHSEARPSRADLAESSYDDVLYLILGASEGGVEARVFVFEHGTCAEVRLTVG